MTPYADASAPPQPTDAALVAASLAGDERAFTTLYRRHGATVYRFAYLWSGTPGIASDVAQETFIHLHTRGTPRVINTLCDNLLFEGFVARTRELDEKMVDRVARDLGFEFRPPVAPGSTTVAARGGDRQKLDLAEIDRYLDSLAK